MTDIASTRRTHPTRRRRPSGRLAAAALTLAGLLAASPASHAAGLMTPAGGGRALTLDTQHVEVTIENGYAVTSVEQTFANPHRADLDARYSFPVPDSAAVGEFTYWIDGVPVHAEVLEKEEARALHEAEKARGAETALVEKDAYRTFEVMVSPVRAGQDVRVRLVYLQRTAVDHAIGRYVYPLEEGGVDEVRDAFWTRDDTVASAFSFRLRLRSAYPVDAVRVPSGRARVDQLDSGEWEVVIDSADGQGAARGTGLADEDLVRARTTGEGTAPSVGESSGGGVTGTFVMDGNGVRAKSLGSGVGTETASSRTASRASGGPGVATLDEDIVVYWRLAENLPGAVDLVTHREPGAAAGTFMLTLTPGIDLAPITEGRDWVFVLDTSGSMQGKFAALVEGVRRALGSLNGADRYRVILFSDRATELTRGYVPADRASIEATLRQLDGLSAGGGTNLFDGLSQAVKSLDDDRTTAVVLVTDGVANVGEREMSRFLKLVEPLDLRLFTAVMGNSANRPLLDGLTEHSQGFAVQVSNDDDIVGLMMQVTSKVTHEALHDIALSIEGVRTRDLTPASHTRVYRGEQLVVLGKYTGDGRARVTLAADVSGKRERYVSDLLFPAESAENPELERLWAFATIEEIEARERLLGGGTSGDAGEAITDLALGHGLVTDHTSMIVVREEAFAREGIERRNATRVERERVARAARSNGAIASTRQDAQAPAFPAPRATTSNGGGAFGLWLLIALAVLAAIRIGLGLGDRVRERRERRCDESPERG